MTTKQQETATIISVELFNKMINTLEVKLMNKATLKNEVKYHREQLNKALHGDFKQMVGVLQTIVDEFYWDYYEVKGFIPFQLEDFDFCLNHNLGIIRSCKKLMKLTE